MSLTSKLPTLKVSEIFATHQGEGPTTGRLCTFLRLALCNLRCKWCDTKYTWDWENYDPDVEIKKMSLIEVINAIHQNYDTERLVISGGEPMLQQKALAPLVAAFIGYDWDIEIETAGTIKPQGPMSHWRLKYNVSPKLSGSGNPQDARFIPEALEWFTEWGDSCFKFVINDEEDLKEACEIVRRFDIPNSRVWLMPQGKTPAEQDAAAETVARWALDKGFNFSGRMHVWTWGDRRGV